jgi:diguanylate cyclase (GGDEF)-like protein/PAS domain S-box-containing protein
LRTHPPDEALISPSIASILTSISTIEEEINDLYQSIPFGSHTAAEDGTYASVNALELSWLGCHREDLLGKKSLADFLTPDSRKVFEAASENFGKTGFHDLELDLLGADGIPRRISLNYWRTLGPNQEVRSHRYVLFDLTKARQASEHQRMAAMAFDAMGAVAILDRRGIVLHTNKAFAALTGYEDDEITGRSIEILNSGHQSPAFYEEMAESMVKLGSWQREVHQRRKDGSSFVAWMHVCGIGDGLDTTSRFVVYQVDVTATRTLQDKISRQAFFDELTELPNRRLLNDRVSQAMARSKRSGKNGAVMFIDLDLFKVLNDMHGHHAGDLLLQQVAKRIAGCLRETDTASRIGGDEFVVLLTDLDEQFETAKYQSKQIAEKIRRELAQPYRLAISADKDPLEYSCTASIGVSVFTPRDADFSDILKQADAAMYRDKNAGRNAVQF